MPYRIPKIDNSFRGQFPVAARQVFSRSQSFRNFKLPSNLTFYLGGTKNNPGSGGGGSPVITPVMTNLFSWYKTSSLVLNDNDPVLSWNDSSGNARTLLPIANNPIYETNELNGKPGVKFNGGVDGFTNGDQFPSDAWAVYIVARQTSASGDAGSLVALGGTVTGYVIMKLTGNKTIVARAVASMVDGAASTNAELWTVNRTSVPLTTLRINDGAAVALTNDGSAASTPDASGTTLGAFAGLPGFNLDGYMFEILIYSASHDAAAIAQNKAYINQEWALW